MQGLVLQLTRVGFLLLLWLSEIERALAGKNGPGDSCKLVGECDNDLVSVHSFGLHSAYPYTKMVFGPIQMKDARTSAMNE